MAQRLRTDRHSIASLLLAGTALLLPALRTTPSLAARYRRATRAAPPRPLKAIWGPLRMPDGSSAFPVYRRLGVQVLELILPWSEVAASRPADPSDPQDPAYVWPSRFEEAVTQASRYGIQIALRVEGFPAWSNGGRDAAWTPSDPEDYASFVRAASRRYPSVRFWMILGEVNYPGNYEPFPPASSLAPRNYALLLDDAFGALKAADPANVVIGGMTYSGGTMGTPEFIRAMRLPSGAPPRMDDYGFNPYSVRYPNIAEKPYSAKVYDINDIDTLEQQLAGVYRSHGPTPRLWLSEFGISTSANGFFDYYVSPAVQARWVRAAFRLVGSVSYVAALGWYELLDEAPPAPGSLSEGLMTEQGTPKPAFAAFATAP